MSPWMVLVMSALLNAGPTISAGYIVPEKGLDVKDLSFVKPHIIGGAAVQGNLYYQISLRIQQSKNIYDSRLMGHFCGGSLVRPDIVLSAAHCLTSEVADLLEMGLLHAVAGSNLLLYKSEASVRAVQTVIIHPLYMEETHDHDVGIFKLKAPFPIDGVTIGLIPLNIKTPPVGTICMISGLGKVRYGESGAIMPDRLQAANVPLLSHEECVKRYIKLRRINRSMLCAGYVKTGGVDSCQGDSGGPLACNNSLTGIVSWGNKCALPGFPGVYSSVEQHREWIESVIAELNGSSFPVPDGPNPTVAASMATAFSPMLATLVLSLAATWCTV